MIQSSPVVNPIRFLTGGAILWTGCLIAAEPVSLSKESRPLAPEAALASMKVPAGYRVELVAAEPLVMDPVAFDWSPDGRLWVAEMRDYPNGLTWNGAGDPLDAPGGRIKVLTDNERRRPLRRGHRFPRRPLLPDRSEGVGQGHPRHRRSRDFLRRRHRW
jgi:hypothetical protein